MMGYTVRQGGWTSLGGPRTRCIVIPAHAGNQSFPVGWNPFRVPPSSFVTPARAGANSSRLRLHPRAKRGTFHSHCQEEQRRSQAGQKIVKRVFRIVRLVLVSEG